MSESLYSGNRIARQGKKLSEEEDVHAKRPDRMWLTRHVATLAASLEE